MSAQVGSAALIAAALLAAYGIIALVAGLRRGDGRWVESGRIAVLVLAGLVTVAVVMMEIALARFDFSLRYVARNVNLHTPLVFRLVALWGALEGSILLWQWLLALFAAIVALRHGTAGARGYWALAVLLGVSEFFLLMMLGPADPFLRLPVAPPDGRGLNPLLQNHPLMAIHPPFLYLGYVGFSLPYAFAMGSLLAGPPHDDWWEAARPWTLFAWTSLTVGLFLGARWSYDVLGWGGYWGWDPVENAAFLPWLVSTALLHSATVQSRRGRMRLWNLGLVVLTFLLTIFGTFLTRSGVLASVHTFTTSLIGPLFFGFLAVATVFSLGIILTHLPRGPDGDAFEGYLSRETAMLLNNVVLLVMAITVFFGTVYPLAVQAITGAQVSVGSPFYERLFAPLGMVLLLLMGAGTVMRWGRSTAVEMHRLVWLAVAAAVIAGVLALNGVRGIFTVIGLGLVAFMALAQIGEIGRAMGAGRRAGQGALRRFAVLLAASPQRYFGYLTHLGLAVVMVGIIASTAYRTEMEAALLPGERMQLASYTLRFEGTQRTRRPDKTVLSANVTVLIAGGDVQAVTAHRGARPATALHPSLNMYPHSPNGVTTPAVRSTWRDDLYVVLMGVDPSGRAILKVISRPLVAWIWVGGLLMTAAAILNLSPRRRRDGPHRAALP